MKVTQIAALAGSVFATIGIFMPLATAANGYYFVSMQHLTGLANILYILPFVSLAIATIGLYKSFPSARWWHMCIGALGILVAYLSIYVAREQVSNLASSFGKYQVHGEIGLGGMFILAGFLAIGVSGAIALGFKVKRKGRFNLNSN